MPFPSCLLHMLLKLFINAHRPYYKVIQCKNCKHITINVVCKQVMDMGIEKKVVSIRLDEEVITELKKCAEEENRPLSNMIETVLKIYTTRTEGNQNGSN